MQLKQLLVDSGVVGVEDDDEELDHLESDGAKRGLGVCVYGLDGMRGLGIEHDLVEGLDVRLQGGHELCEVLLLEIHVGGLTAGKKKKKKNQNQKRPKHGKQRKKKKRKKKDKKVTSPGGGRTLGGGFVVGKS